MICLLVTVDASYSFLWWMSLSSFVCHYTLIVLCIVFFVFWDVCYLIITSPDSAEYFAAEDNMTRLYEQREGILAKKKWYSSYLNPGFLKSDPYDSEEEDKTIYVHNLTEIDRLSQFREGIVFWNFHGGFSNQMYFLISSMILAEAKQVPFFCNYDMLKSFYRCR